MYLEVVVSNLESQADQLVEEISQRFHSSISEYKVKNIGKFDDESKLFC